MIPSPSPAFWQRHVGASCRKYGFTAQGLSPVPQFSSAREEEEEEAVDFSLVQTMLSGFLIDGFGGYGLR